MMECIVSSFPSKTAIQPYEALGRDASISLGCTKCWERIERRNKLPLETDVERADARRLELSGYALF